MGLFGILGAAAVTAYDLAKKAENLPEGKKVEFSAKAKEVVDEFVCELPIVKNNEACKSRRLAAFEELREAYADILDNSLRNAKWGNDIVENDSGPFEPDLNDDGTEKTNEPMGEITMNEGLPNKVLSALFDARGSEEVDRAYRGIARTTKTAHLGLLSRALEDADIVSRLSMHSPEGLRSMFVNAFKKAAKSDLSVTEAFFRNHILCSSL
jgi:hypothetical protein